MNDIFNTFKEESGRVKREVRERTIGYLVAALGLVAGLAWNDAIRALIEAIFPMAENTLVAKFVYAALITVAVVIVSVNLVRFSRNNS